jgi:hypothetical protein
VSETVTEYSCYGWHFLQLSSPTSHVPSVNPHFRYWGYNWAVVGLDDRSLILPSTVFLLDWNSSDTHGRRARRTETVRPCCVHLSMYSSYYCNYKP